MIVEQPPASVPDFAALRRCWHPVGYASALGDAPLRVRLLGEDLVLWRDSGGRRARAARPLHPPRHRALARPRGRRPDHVPVPRLAVRRRRHLHADPAARGPDAHPRQGARRRVHAAHERLGHDLGRAGRAALRRCPTSPSSTIPAGSSCRPARTRGTADASRQLENFTDFGHFPWVHPGLLGDPERPVVPDYTVDDRRPRPALRHRPPRGAEQRRLPGLRQRGRRRRPSGAAATSCTCRTRSCCGSAGAARRAWSTSSPPSRSTRTTASAT